MNGNLSPIWNENDIENYVSSHITFVHNLYELFLCLAI